MSSLIRRALRVILAGLGLALVAALVSGAWLTTQLRASLPQLDGSAQVDGLALPVDIERDGLGIPTIRAASEEDLAAGIGFVHAQDRFFQMDLARRRAAGELAEIFGRAAVPIDRRTRIHRFRQVARRVLGQATASERGRLEAYAAGVNAGLRALDARPFEYLVTRSDPAPWHPEDSVLVICSMFLQLQDESGGLESMQGLVHDLLQPSLAEFLTPRGTDWDTPLLGEPIPMPEPPAPEVIDLRTSPLGDLTARRPPSATPPETLGGSNAWAVAGRHTADGRPLIANDMHLGISVPTIWYRASLVQGGNDHRVTGVTLPGVPSVVVGSNGSLAWGFTNTHGDWSDLVILDVDDAGGTYQTPTGPRRFQRDVERIGVKGEPDERLEIRSTIWGPVIDVDHLGRPRALRWVAHDPEAVNLRLMDLNRIETVEDAMRLVNSAGVPGQNMVAADRHGRIGWTIAGRIPRRTGHDGRVPTSWADGRRGWSGWLEASEYPRIMDPGSGRLWTANNRAVDGKMLERLGDSGYDLGARARQIRDSLEQLDHATVRDMLDIQLDDRALFLARWRDLLLDTLTPDATGGSAAREAFRRLATEGWTGHASVDSVGYRIVHDFREMVARRVLGDLMAPCFLADDRFDPLRFRSYEGPVWALVSQRPAHLIDPRRGTWEQLLLESIDTTLVALRQDGRQLESRTWGEANTADFRHPLSRAVPLLGRWLDLPADRLQGDHHMPRFQSSTAGASERMGVSPGHEAEGYLHIPGGQSGHPLSPHYRDAHRAWVAGEPTPFLPGDPLHRLRLEPTN